ncbi:MAG: LysM peptidoglycan-binding domain-containing protein [Desulfobacterales bacterium]|nr:LysM peptidoglycan-binding domain-containing protein [Desulfobacterales bacterium]
MKQTFFLTCLMALTMTACNTTRPTLSSTPAPSSPTYPYIGVETSAPEPLEFNFSANLRNISLEPPEGTEGELPLFDRAIDQCKEAQLAWEKGEMDAALASLDKAYSLILAAETGDSPKLLQQKEELRLTISKRILEIYTARTSTASFTRNAIPIIINKQVQREIDIFTKNDRKFFERALKRSGRYRPMIVKKLQEAGLPEELSWLPLVESGFSVKALSSARALGLWQFIPSTGYIYGLKRTTFVDERINPEKATDAAIKYLTNLHKLFGDWSTVLAAYNSGEGRVLRLIRRQNINYLDNFWDLYQRLPRETARYVPKFIATLHIVNNLERYGFKGLRLYKPYTYETVTVQKQIKLADMASAIGVGLKTLQILNPELKHSILPQKPYNLNVPPGKGEKALAAIDSLRVSLPPQRAYITHRIRPGDTLSALAKRYRTSVSTIRKVNGLSKKGFIVAGRRIKIPQRGITTRGYYAAPAIKGSKRPRQHVVRKGDSLWVIARKYGTTESALRRTNNLKGNMLKVGQKLKLPRPAVTPITPPKKAVYYVKRGDNPFTIATKHNMSVARLLDLNKLKKGSTIYPGQQLFIE